MPTADFTSGGGQVVDQEPIAFTVDGVRFDCLPVPPAQAFGALGALHAERPGVSVAACVAFIAQAVVDPDLFESWLADRPADPRVVADIVTFLADAYTRRADTARPAAAPDPRRTDLDRLARIIDTTGVGEIG